MTHTKKRPDIYWKRKWHKKQTTKYFNGEAEYRNYSLLGFEHESSFKIMWDPLY